MSVFSRDRAARGFTLVELIVVMAILAIVAAVVIPRFYVTLKRQKLMSPVREIYSIALASRMQAVRRNKTVIMSIDLTNRQIKTWADCVVAPCPEPGDSPNDYLQQCTLSPCGEPTINSYQIPANVDFFFPGTGNMADAVSFDGYPAGAGLTDLIVFKGDGTIVQPQDPNSQPPARVPSSYSIDCGANCRGIYLADLTHDNVFRISVDDFGQTGKVSLLKWQNLTTLYVPPQPSWQWMP